MSEQQTQQTANAQQNNTGGEGNTAKGGTQATYTQEQLDSMVQAREQRASNAALKSYFAQQGMTEEEITQAINTYKTNRECVLFSIECVSLHDRMNEREEHSLQC